jgi:Ca2+-dependent lipid-binding protein
MSVHLVEGNGLVAKDIGGSSDPKAILSVCGQRQVSKVIKKDLNPKWDQHFSFNLPDDDPVLTIEVYDVDLFGADDFMGGIKVPLADLRVSEVRNLTIPVESLGKKGKFKGELIVVIKGGDKAKKVPAHPFRLTAQDHRRPRPR